MTGLAEWLDGESWGGRPELREFYDPADDGYVVIDIDHVRRPKLFLRHLNKLRKTRYIDDLMNKRRGERIVALYGGAPE